MRPRFAALPICFCLAVGAVVLGTACSRSSDPAGTPVTTVSSSPAPTTTPTSATASAPSGQSRPSPTADPALLGTWRVYSSRLFYDQGGGGTTTTAAAEQLVLRADGSWTFGSSKGRWTVAPITSADWEHWGVKPYGPTRKVLLTGWREGSADGPIEETSGRADFVWLIYRVGPPAVGAPGQVQTRFGH